MNVDTRLAQQHGSAKGLKDTNNLKAALQKKPTTSLIKRKTPEEIHAAAPDVATKHFKDARERVTAEQQQLLDELTAPPSSSELLIHDMRTIIMELREENAQLKSALNKQQEDVERIQREESDRVYFDIIQRIKQQEEEEKDTGKSVQSPQPKSPTKNAATSTATLPLSSSPSIVRSPFFAHSYGASGTRAFDEFSPDEPFESDEVTEAEGTELAEVEEAEEDEAEEEEEEDGVGLGLGSPATDDVFSPPSKSADGEDEDPLLSMDDGLSTPPAGAPGSDRRRTFVRKYSRRSAGGLNTTFTAVTRSPPKPTHVNSSTQTDVAYHALINKARHALRRAQRVDFDNEVLRQQVEETKERERTKLVEMRDTHSYEVDKLRTQHADEIKSWEDILDKKTKDVEKMVQQLVLGYNSKMESLQQEIETLKAQLQDHMSAAAY